MDIEGERQNKVVVHKSVTGHSVIINVILTINIENKLAESCVSYVKFMYCGSCML